MPRMQVYLPDELYALVKKGKLPASELLLWSPVVPSAMLVGCLQGREGHDANENRLLKSCDVVERVSETLARRAALLRRLARRGSAIDALVVASAEPGGTVFTSDPRDLEALASHADSVEVVRV